MKWFSFSLLFSLCVSFASADCPPPLPPPLPCPPVMDPDPNEALLANVLLLWAGDPEPTVLDPEAEVARRAGKDLPTLNNTYWVVLWPNKFQNERIAVNGGGWWSFRATQNGTPCAMCQPLLATDPLLVYLNMQAGLAINVPRSTTPLLCQVTEITGNWQNIAGHGFADVGAIRFKITAYCRYVDFIAGITILLQNLPLPEIPLLPLLTNP